MSGYLQKPGSGGVGGGTWGSITGTLSNQTDLQNALNLKYDASNPAGYSSRWNCHRTRSY